MNYKVEVRVSRYAPSRGKASVHVAMGEGGFTISNIAIWEENGKFRVQMPLVQLSGGKHPAITLQGEIKQKVLEEIAAQFKNAAF